MRTDWNCESCDYSLAFTSEDRCPECGEWFDPDYLADLHSEESPPTLLWDSTHDFATWRKTVFLVLFRRQPFARELPFQPSALNALRFSLSIHLPMMAATTFVQCLMLLYCRWDDRNWPRAISHGGFARLLLPPLLLAFEIATGVVLALILPTRRKIRRLPFWVACMHYHAAHWVIIYAAILIALAAKLLSIVARIYDRTTLASVLITLATLSTLLVACPLTLHWVFRMAWCVYDQQRIRRSVEAFLVFLGAYLYSSVLMFVFESVRTCWSGPMQG